MPLSLLVALGILGSGALLFAAFDDDDDDGDSDDRVTERSGTEDGDFIEGDDGRDRIDGDDGDDFISGGGGDDTLVGNEGSDLILGDNGDDLIRGNQQGDIALGGAGDDTVLGYLGDDYLAGGTGDDLIQGGFGDDLLVGVEGSPVEQSARTATFRDEIFSLVDEDAEAGDVSGEGSNDTLDGGAGDDILVLGDGDVATGGDGADLFVRPVDPGAAGTLAEITDFDPRTERLALTVRDGDALFGDVTDPAEDAAIQVSHPVGTAAPEVTFSEADGDTIVQLDGIGAVRLSGITGLTGADVATIAV